jgi:hypothetical protein
MGARSRKKKLSEKEVLGALPFSAESLSEDARDMRGDLGPRPYGAPPRFAGDDPWLSPETWPQMPMQPDGRVSKHPW